MTLRVLPFLLPAAPVWAQFSNLATTHDGSAVYFDTALRQKGSSQPGHGKIFRAGQEGAQAYAVREAEAPTGNPAVSNYYDLSEPSVSGDGQVVAYAGRRDCVSGRPCTGIQFTATRITGVPGRGVLELSGRARLSRNGRFAFVYRTDSLDSTPAGLWDLESGAQLSQGSESGVSGQPVADDGTTVAANFGLRLLRKGVPRYLELPGESCQEAVIDASGRTIVFTSRWWEPYSAYSRLRLLDPETGTAATLAEGFGDVFGPSISADGSTVLFLSTARFSPPDTYGPAQVFLTGTKRAAAPRQLTEEPAGIRSATLSGDGRVAYAITGEGKLLRIDTGTGAATALIARTPAYWGTPGPAAGSLYRFEGAGLIDGQGQGPRITIGGEAVPIVSASATEVLIQIPWGAGQGLHFETTSDSPFEPPAADAPFATRSLNPNAWPLPASYGTQAAYGMRFGLAAHERFEGLLTEESPARRGEIVHVYATGLGAVDRTVRTGEPGPADPPARLAGGTTCQIPTLRGFAPARVLWAGLAPALVGIYQLDLEIPGDLTAELSYPNRIQVQCRFDEGRGELATVLPLAP